MRIAKCDVCHREFTVGYAVHVRPVSHAARNAANVNMADLVQSRMTEYDVCLDCMKGMVQNELQKTPY